MTSIKNAESLSIYRAGQLERIENSGRTIIVSVIFRITLKAGIDVITMPPVRIARLKKNFTDLGTAKTRKVAKSRMIKTVAIMKEIGC
jgi:hypothetical protein